MGKADQVLALLGKTELFGGLPDTELQLLAENFRDVRFGKGEMLFARSDAGEHLYLIADGRVRLATSTDEGRELSFRHAAPGEVLGEIAALDGGPRSAERSEERRVGKECRSRWSP